MTHKSNTDNPVDFPKLETETNLRIRQLAEQAGAETWSCAPMRAVTGLAFTDENLEKFAELIVGECMRMCDVAAIGYESHNHFKEANGCYSAKEYIEEHFGVEE
jgi:hypothetical protein